MRVLLAGATGAVGRPMVRLLVRGGHEVLGLTRTAAGARLLARLGGTPLVADVLDRDGLLATVAGHRADAVVHQLTALSKAPTRHRHMAATDRLRTTGTRRLLDAAEAVGASRFVLQSMMLGYGYDLPPGTPARTEDAPFAPPGRGAFERHLAALREAEGLVLRGGAVEGVSLRYGLFYGPGASDDMVAAVRRRMLPVVAGAAPLSWVWVEDAAAAAVQALETGRGGSAYNVADDEPVGWEELVRGLARALGAPAPPTLPRWLLPVVAPYGRVVLEGGVTVDSGRAHRELGWRPAVPTWREGVVRLAAGPPAA